MPVEVDARGMMDLYARLPIIIVGSLAELLPENLEAERQNIYNKMMNGEYKLEELFMQYWVDKIYSHTNDKD
eukprot:gene5766-biopygen3634